MDNSSPVGSAAPVRRRYPIREPNRGQIVAYHVREDGPSGKRMWWTLPDGTLGLGGLRTEDLPLYGAAAAARWDVERPVIVVEGEKAAHALAHVGWQAVGTATGAAGSPSREPLMVLAGMDVILWPDNDEAGRAHMQRLAAGLGPDGGIAASIRSVAWPDASPGADAADAVTAGANVAALVAAAGPMAANAPAGPRPAHRPSAVHAPRRADGAESPIERFNARVGVSAVLARQHGVDAAPGRTVRCPAHEDRHASLSVLRDDRRVYCHAPGCPLNNDGRGRDAYDLAHLAGAPG